MSATYVENLPAWSWRALGWTAMMGPAFLTVLLLIIKSVGPMGGEGLFMAPLLFIGFAYSAIGFGLGCVVFYFGSGFDADGGSLIGLIALLWSLAAMAAPFLIA